MKNFFKYIVLCTAGVFIFLTIYFFRMTISVKEDVFNYLDAVSFTERQIIENLSVYEDYNSDGKDKKLREFLLKHHLEAVKRSGLSPVRDDLQTAEYYKTGVLEYLPASTEDMYYFYNVSKERRYLSGPAKRALHEVCERFNSILKIKGDLPEVKLAISSAVRPLNYQRELADRNANAAVLSTHSYGVSFDIFFDDYYIVLPEAKSSNSISSAILERLRTKTGFMLGDSLRSQLRSVLVEALLQLQDEGRIIVIFEKKQRCYHVTAAGEKKK